MRRVWRYIVGLLAPEQPLELNPPRLLVDLRPFDWLEEYGPHWEPGSTAFWLEPRKESDLVAWLRRYRPHFHGEFEAAGLSVVVPRSGLRYASTNGAVHITVMGAGGGGGGGCTANSMITWVPTRAA